MAAIFEAQREDCASLNAETGGHARNEKKVLESNLTENRPLWPTNIWRRTGEELEKHLEENW